MKLAIMQPYFLPYIGYFQLMAAADRFVVYDDVNFIPRGWINRNRILLDGVEHLFVIPVRGASQNRRINELELVPEKGWRTKLLATVTHAYRRAPYFQQVFPVIREIVGCVEENLARYLFHSLQTVKTYLQIESHLVQSSSVYHNRSLKGPARILDICLREGATVYLNLSGGRTLYDPGYFAAHRITLQFMEPPNVCYQQFGEPFRPGLSIVDVLMFNSPDVIRRNLLPSSHSASLT